MGLKSVVVSKKKIELEDRFEPEFWVIGDFLNKVFKQYNWKKLDSYSESIKKGIFDLKANRYQRKGIPFLRISNLKYFELGTEDLVYISEEDHKANKKTILRQGDIAFSKIGTLGKIVRIGKRFPEVNISQNIIGVRLKENVNKNYIFAYLLSKIA